MAVCMLCGATITQVSLAVHDTSVQHLEACLRQWEVLALRVVRHGLGWRGHRGTLPDMTVVELHDTIRRILERPKDQRALLAKVRQGHYGACHVVAAYWQTLRRPEAQGVRG